MNPRYRAINYYVNILWLGHYITDPDAEMTTMCRKHNLEPRPFVLVEDATLHPAPLFQALCALNFTDEDSHPPLGRVLLYKAAQNHRLLTPDASIAYHLLPEYQSNFSLDDKLDEDYKIQFATGQYALNEDETWFDVRHKARAITRKDFALDVKLQIKEQDARFYSEEDGTRAVINSTHYLNTLVEKFYPLHYAHRAQSDPAMLAFYETEAKLKADVVTVIKPGKYLQRFFGHLLKPHEIAATANDFRRKVTTTELKFARTCKEIKWVFEHGPSSCMGKDAHNFDCYPHHPCEAYATPDFSIAYLVNNTDTDRITARAVCSEINKNYNRIYGNDAHLADALVAAGYTPDARDFEDHRLLAIEHNDRYIGPYIDGTEYDVHTTDDPQYLRITDSSNHEHVGTTHNSHDSCGYLQAGIECDECGNQVHTNELTETVDSNQICQRCLEDNYYEALDDYGRYTFIHHNDPHLVEADDGTCFITACAAESYGYVYADYAGIWVKRGDAVETVDCCWELESDCVYSEYHNNYILINDAIPVKRPDGDDYSYESSGAYTYSEVYEAYVFDDDCVDLEHYVFDEADAPEAA